MKNTLTIFIVLAAGHVYAGFGGMGNVDAESTGNLSDLVWGALIIAALWWAYTSWRDRP
jgi:hypothetical protein